MSSELKPIASSSPELSLSQDLQRFNKIPLLTEEEEFSLATKYQTEGDLPSAQKLVLSHMRYVVKVARGYSGYGLNFGDLVQEGAMGLMKAVKRFSPTHGVRLVSFAVHWIKAEIQEYIIRNWKIVKVATTKAQRKLFFNLRSSKTHLGWFTKEEVEEVAKDLGVTPKDVLEMEGRLTANEVSFDADDDSEENTFAPALYLESKEQDPAIALSGSDFHLQTSAKLYEVLETLDVRSQDIIKQRWLAEEKTTLKDLAEQYKVSIERVRQLEAAAIEKLRFQLEEHFA